MRRMNIRHSLPLSFLAATLCLAYAQQEESLAQASDVRAIADGIYTAEPAPSEQDERMHWWREAKFGMFIHYGLYSGLGGEFKGQKCGAEWTQRNLRLDSETYAREALPRFKPAPGCTEEWAELAAQAGCSYVVLTTKHHDGFALWNTAQSDFSASKALGRDLVREFVESARARELYVGFYHSVIDWHHPAYDHSICPDLCYPEGQADWLRQRNIPRDHEAYKAYLHAQVRELLTNYGQVDIMWWDYSQGAAEGERAWGAPALMQMCRELQPGVIMNNRLYAYSGLDPDSDKLGLDLAKGDFATPEKHVPAEYSGQFDWETCLPVGHNWGYNRYDTQLKSPAAIIRHLQECVSRGGNLLLNINPRADGSVPEGVADCFLRIGAWMDVNGEAIYGSEAVPHLMMPEGNLCVRVEEDLCVFLPGQAPADGCDYVLRLLARQVDAVRPSILGQPDCKLKMERIEVEEEGRDEPTAYLCISIPASAWQQAPEGLPVLLLAADY